MSYTQNLGGERLGAEGKMSVELEGYGKSNHRLPSIWKSSVSPGLLYPCRTEVLIPGDEGVVYVDARVNTHPTLGPLFDEFKLQIDGFVTPYRLYNSRMRGNMSGVGLDMSTVKLPTITLTAMPIDEDLLRGDVDNAQINSSCLLKYLGIAGVGITDEETTRDFNATEFLNYWDIYERYYSNKMEKKGAVIHCEAVTASPETITAMNITTIEAGSVAIPIAPGIAEYKEMTQNATITIGFTGAQPNPKEVFIYLLNRGLVSVHDLTNGMWYVAGSFILGEIAFEIYGRDVPINYQYGTGAQPRTVEPRVVFFDLENIDLMRHEILSFNQSSSAYNVNSADLEPYKWIWATPGGFPNMLCSQEGLAVKTYLSDKFNTWLDTDYMDTIATSTAISTAGDVFRIDQLLLGEKLYNLLNRIAVSGGTVQDWIDAAYGMKVMRMHEMPIYVGGLVDSVQFDAVFSQSATDTQPLATLAGKGRNAGGGARRGGTIRIDECQEPCIFMLIASITPRVGYSQGNKWSTSLETINDLFKPALNQLGFEDLMTEEMAWFDVKWNGTTWVKKAAGKQPAWMAYRTTVNENRGNFAVRDNEMFMTLNRRYEYDATDGIKDLTSYVDPTLYNFIFADSAIDAQNFWLQVSVDMQLRRKVSSRLMPML